MLVLSIIFPAPYLGLLIQFAKVQEKLKPLPEERFEVRVWKSPKVHKSDGFLNFEAKRYAVPPAYRNCGRVKIRYTERSQLLRVFYADRLIREYVVSHFLSGF